MALVIEDYVPPKNVQLSTQLLSVHSGQQVEIVDYNITSVPDFCLVRVINNNTMSHELSYSPDNFCPQEGLVPLNVLRFTSRPAMTAKSVSMDSEGMQSLCIVN